jgi:hypothetical protein
VLHSDLFPDFGCDGELVELPERWTQLLTVEDREETDTCKAPRAKVSSSPSHRVLTMAVHYARILLRTP